MTNRKIKRKAKSLVEQGLVCPWHRGLKSPPPLLLLKKKKKQQQQLQQQQKQ